MTSEELDLYLLALEIYHDMILKNFPEDLTKELHEFIIDLEKRWVTIDGRHVNIGGDDSSGGGNSVSDSSGEFHAVTDDAIESIPEITEFDSKELNQAVHTACKDILKAVKKDPPGTEATISISLDLTQKSKLQKGESGAGAVKPIKLNVPYVSVHNHASGETFSDRDIRKFIVDEKAKAICVVGNNGRVYILQKTKSFNWIQFGIKTHPIDDDNNYNLQVLMGADKYGLQYHEK